MSVKACVISKRDILELPPFSPWQAARRVSYPLLGLNLPTDDWWELLQMEPEAYAKNCQLKKFAA